MGRKEDRPRQPQDRAACRSEWARSGGPCRCGPKTSTIISWAHCEQIAEGRVSRGLSELTPSLPLDSQDRKDSTFIY